MDRLEYTYNDNILIGRCMYTNLRENIEEKWERHKINKNIRQKNKTFCRSNLPGIAVVLDNAAELGRLVHQKDLGVLHLEIAEVIVHNRVIGSVTFI